MPIYEYECQKCNHAFSIQQRMSDQQKRKCPKCEKRSLKKLISPSSFILKGKGWFKDGY